LSVMNAIATGVQLTHTKRNILKIVKVVVSLSNRT
jgi:hypothetical protein